MSRNLLRVSITLGCWLILSGGIALVRAEPDSTSGPTLPILSGAFTMNIGASPSPTVPAQAGNLIQEGGFEQQAANWEGCGNLGLVDTESAGSNAVYAGRYAVFMGAGADGSGCPTLPDNTTPRQILTQQLSIPTSAEAVTVSFWFRGAAGTSVDVFLARGFYVFDPDLGGVKLGTFSTEQPPGWQLYRTVLTGEDLDRVRGQTLRFSIVIQQNTAVGPEAVLLIDEVQVLAGDGRTAASPLPPALRGDGSRPLAAIRTEAGNYWLYRMDTDGGNRQLIYRGLLNNVRYLAWSPDGRRLAVADYNTWPWPTPDPDPQNNLSAAAVTVLNADGSGARQLYQTQSRKGSRCPFVPDPPGSREDPSQIVRVSELDWMPGNDQVAFTQVGFNAFCDGNIRGGLGDVRVLPQQPGQAAPLLASFATRPSVNRNGEVLFDGFDLARDNRAAGVWLLDTRSQPAQETRLLTDAADQQPAWAPDGRRFAVVRVTTVPSADARNRISAIMLYDRQDLTNPRMLLLADHGRSIGRVRWSPDGAYLIYTLGRFDGGSDIWWLEVSSGATGPITSDGAWVEAAWRPAAGGGSQVFLPLLVRN